MVFTIEPRRSRKHPAKKITDADYADDLALLNDKIKDAQRFLTKLEEAASSFGLRINSSKTKCMSTAVRNLATPTSPPSKVTR